MDMKKIKQKAIITGMKEEFNKMLISNFLYKVKYLATECTGEGFFTFANNEKIIADIAEVAVDLEEFYLEIKKEIEKEKEENNI